MYANVIVEISHEKLDKTFQYKIPEELQGEIYEGAVVKVPFGRGNKLISAYVIELVEKAEFDIEKMKYIEQVVNKKITTESKMIRLAAFIKRNFGGTMSQALKTVIPVKEDVNNKEKKVIKLILNNEELFDLIETCKKKNAKARARLLEILVDNNEVPYETVTKQLNISSQTINSLVEMGAISIERELVYRNPKIEASEIKEPPGLNAQQSDIVKRIVSDFQNDIRKTYLIHGVTGSGKTEVYLNVIQSVLDAGQQVIMLIPEISLTYQTVRRFYERFGEDVAIINSRLSKGEKFDQLMRARNNEVSIVVGPRSALFTPFEKLGLIIIDEEHESAYKSESVPRYHTRDVAMELARISNASLILGSATPSVESYYRAQNGEYELFTMNKRAVENSRLPQVYIEDLRKELKEGNRTIFSRKLQELIRDRMEKKQQIMLFINRRGYSNFISCRSCGEVIKCPHCDVSLKLHNNNTLICHYCGYEVRMPNECPACSSKYIAGFGIGTQKVEDEFRKIYPNAKILRMDYDTTTKKDDYSKILSAFEKGEAQVLIGTQMIVKGHDYPGVTLVGIIAADLSLYSNDYRAGERTFELITQAAGRAGRGELAGEVVIQTYSPENYSIVAAANQDYSGFYNEEIMFREMLSYPPIQNMLAVKLSSDKMELCEECAQEMYDFASQYIFKDITIIGPVNAKIYKKSDIFTNLVYIKDSDYNVLTFIKDKIEEHIKDNYRYRYVSVQFDFNPMNI